MLGSALSALDHSLPYEATISGLTKMESEIWMGLRVSVVSPIPPVRHKDTSILNATEVMRLSLEALAYFIFTETPFII